MSERFKVFFQNGSFKILDPEEKKKFINYCNRHNRKMGTVEIVDGFYISLGGEDDTKNTDGSVSGLTGECNKEKKAGL